MEAHIIRALLWKLWRSSRRTYIKIPVFILIPILIAVALTRTKVEQSGEGIYENATFPQPISYKNFNQLIDHDFDILYYPDNDNTKIIMARVRSLMKTSHLETTVKGSNSTEEMESWLAQKYKNSTNFYGALGFGIIFKELSKDKLVYAMRSTKMHIWNTKSLFPANMPPGRLESGSYYLGYGFVPIQSAINMGFMDYLGLELKEDWAIQDFPYPGYLREKPDAFKLVYMVGLPIVFVFGLMPILISLLGYIVTEKSSGSREILKMNGVNYLGIYGYWLAYVLWQFLIVITVTVILLKTDFKNGAILEYSNPFLLWTFFMLYAIHAVFMVFFVSSIFSNSTYASVFYLFIVLAISFLITNFEKPTGSAIGLLLILTPLGSINHGIRVIISLESSKQGLQFSNLFYTIPNGGAGPMMLIIFGIICGCSLFTLLFSYIDAIKPGDYGTAKPWYFFLPGFMRKMCRIEPDLNTDCTNEFQTSKSIVEDTDLPVGIKINKLYKIYGALNAVNGVTMDIYKNQITVLLGHNGAGKTTLMSILTGMISPTCGEVVVNGMNLFKNMTDFRKEFGFCPQHDILLQDLSVQEQIVFFGMVRGIQKAQVSRDSIDLMSKFDIEHRKDALPKELSGGMKRKLCLAISLANNPNVLFLDEPTSGLDPQSRRGIWDTLLALRGNRTMIITTHFMEEADVLGDKIAIMAHGELRCYGTSIFLKKQFGSGHKVTVTYTREGNPNNIMNAIKNQIPSVQIFNNDAQHQVIFNAPLEDTGKLSSVFSDLESIENKSKIREIGVTCTSMEEVFLKVQEGEGISTDFDETDFSYMGKDNLHKDSGAVLVFNQLCSLFLKRLLCLKSTIPFVIASLIFAPAYFTYQTFVLSNSISENVAPTPFNIDLKNYGKTTVLVGGKNDSFTNAYIKNVHLQGSEEILSSKSTESELFNFAENDLTKFRNNLIVAADFLNNPIAFYSSVAIHSPAIAVNMLFNALINALSNTPKTIETINHPYSFEEDPCDLNMIFSLIIPIAWIFFGFGMVLSTTYFTRFPIYEMANGMKHLQYMSGLSPITYWASNLLFDLGLFSLVLLVFLATAYSCDANNLLHDFDVVGLLLLTIILYAVSMMCLTYLSSFVFKTHSGAINTLSIASCILAPMPFLMDWLTNDNTVAHYIFHLSPTTPFLDALFHIMSVAKDRLLCQNCSRGSLAQYCKETRENPNFNAKTSLIFLAVDIALFYTITLLLDYGWIQYGIHLIKERLYGPIVLQSDSVDSDVSTEKLKVANSTLNTDYRKKSHGSSIHSERLEDLEIDIGDTNFSGGSTKSNAPILRNSGEIPPAEPRISSIEDLVLITDNLGKKYGRNLTAVYDVSFTAGKGECFGLLGVNGAGKTTTFSMLTGQIYPSRGDASMHVPNGYHTLNGSRSNFLQNIGYCPQENNISEELTTRQLLNHFAVLRGASSRDVRKLTEQWIRNLDLHLYCDKPCGKYSGGNKRKLCTAIALIADPPVIMLDEPTTGVDPVTKRKLWKVFKQIQKNDQTIILTSHSMDECEATCDRLTIMVSGKMRCIGNIQYLKHKFAQGFTIFIKIDILASDDEIKNIKESLSSSFGSSCLLKDEYKGFLHYHLGNINYSWSQLFDKMETIKKQCGKIDEYMLSDTSLEQVFLSLAKEQKSQDL